MARYFFHLRDGTDELLDQEGREFADLEAVRAAALRGARDIIGNEVKSGGLVDLRYRIDAETEAGEIVYSLPFKHAVNIIPE
ncbi:MAG TPA: hypothetical protein VGC56_01520 [Allosphingosinicella sp.]|jgi:hypothetical protein